MSQTAQKTPPKPTDDPQAQTVWLFAAAIAAWNVGINPEGPLESKWDSGFDEESEMAQFFLLRAEQGEAVFDELAAVLADLSDGGDLELKKPKGFKSWAQTARDLFAKLLDPETSELEVGQVVRWSPYHLRLVTKPGDKDKLYDERVEQEVSAALVASLQEYGGNYDLIKVAVPTSGPHRGELVVVDGRQRTHAAIVGNAKALRHWWWELQEVMRRDGVGAAAKLAPPRLGWGLDCIVKPMGQAALLKNLSNSAGARTPETVLQEARCCWELEDLGNNAPKIGKLRGHNEQTVRNYLSLRKLAEEFLGAIKGGSVSVKTGYRLARESAKRQAEAWKHVQTIEAAARKAEKERSHYVGPLFETELLKKRDEAINAWLDGSPAQGNLPEVPPPVPTKAKVQTHDRIARFRLHLARLPASPVVDSCRLLVGALLGEQKDIAQLPPMLRAGVGDAWAGFSAEERDAWNAAGVWDPATIEDLDAEQWNAKEDAHVARIDRINDKDLDEEDEDEDDEDLDEGVTPEQAARPWSGGGTLGAAVEAGKLTAKAFWQELRQEQLALPAGDQAETKPGRKRTDRRRVAELAQEFRAGGGVVEEPATQVVAPEGKTEPTKPRMLVHDMLSSAAIAALTTLRDEGAKPRQGFNPGVAQLLEREGLVFEVMVPTPFKKGPAQVRGLEISEGGALRLEAELQARSERTEVDPLTVDCPSCNRPAGEACEGGKTHLIRKVKTTTSAGRPRKASDPPTGLTREKRDAEWESAGVFDERKVAELEAAGLVPEDLAHVESVAGAGGTIEASLGTHFTHNRVLVEDVLLRIGRRALAELGGPRNAATPAVDLGAEPVHAPTLTPSTDAAESPDPALAVPCSTCHRAAGEPCESPSGGGSHPSRRQQAAQRQGKKGKRQAPAREVQP